MDQRITGKFIAQRRKELGLTQRELADVLGISDKTVSKWECGAGLPEVSLMLPLCKELGISVNELLSGRTLQDVDYKEKAEHSIVDLMQEKARAKRLSIAYTIVGLISVFAGIVLIMCSGLAGMPTLYRVLLIVIGFITIFAGCIGGMVMELSLGAFACKHCGNRFVPKAKAYLFGEHTFTHRRLKCPKCGKKGYCRRVLTLQEEKVEINKEKSE